MNGLNQKTLFQTWGTSLPQNKVSKTTKVGKKESGRRKNTHESAKIKFNVKANNTALPFRSSLWGEIGQGTTCTYKTTNEVVPAEQNNDDEDDDIMLVAVYEAEKGLQQNAQVQEDPTSELESITITPTTSSAVCYKDFPGFDSSSAKVWIYPINYPLREYQLKMSEAALFQNTLVCLPTGLGKTFIASVVMYNFYRWYPSGKIVFMAPTKPLVAQQIEACYKVMGIPQAHMAELTGSISAGQREGLWKSKRVFFLTPQVMVNDLSRDTCPALEVKCVVIDEAHKALGNHAYCQVVRQLGSQTQQFRVLALSATPGGDAKSVQQVLSNLLVSHIELRSEESPDIQAHSHQRSLEKMVVPLGEALTAKQTRYLEVLEKFASRLIQNRAIFHKDLRSLTKYQLILAREQFRRNPPSHLTAPQQGALEGDFALCISLYHGYELLLQMGLRSLFCYVKSIMDGSREMSRAKNELQRTPTFMDLYRDMEQVFLRSTAGGDEPFFFSHPKLQRLEEVVLQHFKQWSEDSAGPTSVDRQPEVSTRVMIFSSFRESVQEIATMLNRHQPLIKVMTFMGQASTGKGVRGFTQKEQLEVVRRFREGGFNTLVSTCVGEEGLDIGEVDLIVCFDAQKSPIRLVQRMGRTGRKRKGRIVVILAEGREEKTYNQSQSNMRSVYKSILSNKHVFHMHPDSPRMMPAWVKPTLHKMHITCGEFDHCETGRQAGRVRKSAIEGQESLIHPHNLVRQKSGGKQDWFLSPSEYSLWASTMKLEDDEVKPRLTPSHFLSLPDTDTTPQEQMPVGSFRELSLWEWRHWQNNALPTHTVDHSTRCLHFTKVMELIDTLRQEDEGVCCYEQELLPYLRKTDVVGLREDRQTEKAVREKIQRNRKTSSKPMGCKLKPWCAVNEQGDTVEGNQGEKISTWTKVRDRLAVERFDEQSVELHSEVLDIDSDCVMVTEENDILDVQSPSPHLVPREGFVCSPVDLLQSSLRIKSSDNKTKHEEEDVELGKMFFLPKWSSDSSSSELVPVKCRADSLRVILANVSELLARSPPSLTFDLEGLLCDLSPTPIPAASVSLWAQPEDQEYPRFQVNFALEVEDDLVSTSPGGNPVEGDSEDNKSYHDSHQNQKEQPSLHPSPLFPEPLGDRGAVPESTAASPTWEEVFEDDVHDADGIGGVNERIKADVSSASHSPGSSIPCSTASSAAAWSRAG
ncbi:Fanconi anemia group M protein [Aplochiton taeniatus]